MSVDFGLYIVALLTLLVIMIISGVRDARSRADSKVKSLIEVSELFKDVGRLSVEEENKPCINKKQRLYFNRKLK